MLNLEQVKAAMQNCEQTKDLSVYQHGEMVSKYFLDIYNHLKGDVLKYDQILPEWLIENKLFILDQLNRFDLSEILTYQLYHDCGKPYCKTIDELGKQHFFNHSQVSYDIWKQVSNNEFIGTLIKQDMDIHLLKSENIEEFCSRDHAIILLLTGLAEINANASMFGGTESTSFKIKYKHINKKGKLIIEKLKEKCYENK